MYMYIKALLNVSTTSSTFGLRCQPSLLLGHIKKKTLVVPDKSLLQTLLVSFGGMDEPNKFRNKRHMLAPGTKVQRM